MGYAADFLICLILFAACAVAFALTFREATEKDSLGKALLAVVNSLLAAACLYLAMGFIRDAEAQEAQRKVTISRDAQSLLRQSVAAEDALVSRDGRCSASPVDVGTISPQVASLMTREEGIEASAQDYGSGIFIEAGHATKACVIHVYAGLEYEYEMVVLSARVG
jgi:hypothetical protein